jgi:hypothetical protein
VKEEIEDRRQKSGTLVRRLCLRDALAGGSASGVACRGGASGKRVPRQSLGISKVTASNLNSINDLR